MLTRQLNERQRMQYLEALGLDSFVPRWALPAAQPSPQCVLPESDSESRVQASPGTAVPPQGSALQSQPAPQAERASAPAVGALVDQLLDKPAAERKVTKPVAADEQTKVRPTPVEEASFSLAFWRVHPDVMIVDSRRPQLLPTEALLSSLLMALNLSQRLPRAEVQTWPLPGGGDRSWSAAREMIHAFLEGKLLSDPVRYLVLMGAGAGKAVVEQPPEHFGRVSLNSFACDAILTPSLADVLLQPTDKRQVWRLLAPLRQQLALSQ